MNSIRSRLIKLCLRPELHDPEIGTAALLAGLIGRLFESHTSMEAQARGQVLTVEMSGQKFLVGVLPLSPTEVEGEEVRILETNPPDDKEEGLGIMDCRNWRK